MTILRRFFIACLDAKVQARPYWVDPPALRLVCAWCRVIVREGAEPASHGMCDGCRAKLHAELDAAERRGVA
jgi:hypothetical protein